MANKIDKKTLIRLTNFRYGAFGQYIPDYSIIDKALEESKHKEEKDNDNTIH